jgi:hypothetical protein
MRFPVEKPGGRAARRRRELRGDRANSQQHVRPYAAIMPCLDRPYQERRRDFVDPARDRSSAEAAAGQARSARSGENCQFGKKGFHNLTAFNHPFTLFREK